MTSNGKLKKAAREYAAERNLSYTEALRRVKHLKRGDRVKVTIPGLCRFEATVLADQIPATDMIPVRRTDDGSEQAHPRDNIDFLEREEHKPHPPGWKKRPMDCQCHKEAGSHELCCGYADGRNPDCPIHGDGSYT